MGVDKFEAWRFRKDVLMERELELWGNLKGKIAPQEALADATTPIITSRQIVDGMIIKTIKVSLDGMAVLGTQAKDAIAPVGALAAIGRYVVATDGICMKIEMSCIVAPSEGTATIEQDIDLGADDDGAILQGGDPIDDIVLNTATLVAGETIQKLNPVLTANDYIFLIEGGTAATTGIYDGGLFIIKFYGYPITV